MLKLPGVGGPGRNPKPASGRFAVHPTLAVTAVPIDSDTARLQVPHL